MKLAVKIPLVFVAIAVTPLLILSGFYYFSARDLLARNVLAHLDSQAAIQENRIQDLVTRYETRIAHLAELPLVRSDLKVYLTTPTKAAQSQLEQDVARVVSAFPSTKNFYVFDTSGRVVASSTPSAIGAQHTQPHEGDYLAQAFVKGLKAVDVTTIFKNKTQPVTTINERGADVRLYLAGPIMNDMTPLGVAVIETSVDDLFSIFKDHTGLGKTGEWGVAMRAANGDALMVVPGRFDEDPASPLEATLSKNNTNAPISKALQKEEKVFSDLVDYKGNPVLGATRYIERTDWGLGIKMSRSEAFAPIDSLSETLFSVGAVLGLIAIVVSAYIAQSIVLPLGQLHRAARNLAAGNFSHRARVSGRDEVGGLAAAFNIMAEKLQGSYAQLEGKVKDKTKELAEKVMTLEQSQKATLNLLEDLRFEKRKLEQEKSKAEAIVENIGEGIVATYRDGRVLLLNHAAEEMLGWQFADLFGKKFAEMVAVQDEQGGEVALEKRPIEIVLRTGKPQTATLVFARKDGKTFPASVTSTPILSEGEIVGAVASFRDVTQERAIDRAKSEFVTLASHQLRTPISAISWFSEMLLDGDSGKLNEDQHDQVAQIYHSSERMAALVSEMLVVSSIELGNLPVDPEPLDISVLAHDALTAQLKGIADQKTLHVKEEYDSHLGKLMLDPEIIQMVLSHLMSNAVKYTPDDGKISVSISVSDHKLASHSKGSVSIVISDSGYGIPKSSQSKIFTKFFRAPNIRARDTDGTGLGLYIVRALLGYVGGTIHYTSAEDMGATFVVQLPIEGMAPREPLAEGVPRKMQKKPGQKNKKGDEK